MSCDHTQTHMQSCEILEGSLIVRWLGPSLQSWVISLHYTSLFQVFFFFMWTIYKVFTEFYNTSF